MNTVEKKAGPNPNPIKINFWRLWLGNTVLVSAGLLFFLATRYGTYEFFGVACLMALLPLIPLLVLVGGAGSTIFVLTKVAIDKRALSMPAALALLLGPGLVLAGLLVLLGIRWSPGHRLAYLCLGNAPAAATHIRVTGYSTFLREEWLTLFNVSQKDFQTMIGGAQMSPVDDFEFRKMIGQSSLQRCRLMHSMPLDNNLPCFKRVLKEKEERQRGSVYALFDPATSTAVVFRECRD